MAVAFYPLGCVPDDALVFAVNVARKGERYLFCRHQSRSTWECPGGHIEPGETPLEAARRELYEETGAVEAEVEPLCLYRVNGGAWGLLCRADVRVLGALPQGSEIAEARLFDQPPADWTYPSIIPQLLQRALR